MAKESTPKIISKKHLARLEKERIQNRYIMIISIIVLVLVVAVVTYGILDQTVFRGMKPVARVGSEKITTTEFEKYVRFQRQQVINQYNSTLELAQSFGENESLASYFQSSLTQMQNQLTNPETLGAPILDQMINDRLIRQEAKRRGIAVTDAEVEKVLQEYFQYYKAGTPTPEVVSTDVPASTVSPDQLALIATLVPTIDPTQTVEPTAEVIAPTTELTVEATASNEPTPTVVPQPTPTEYTFAGYQKLSADYFKSLVAINFSEADLRDLIEFSLYRRKLAEEIVKDLKPVQDQVWARHILVSTQEEALAIKARYENGENWAALALEKSKDTSNSANGGDLGWFGHGKMVAQFEAAAYAAPIGSVTAPVQTEFGWHIIQIIGHEERPLSATEFNDLKDKTFQTWLDNALITTEVIKFDYWKEVVPSDPSL